MAGCAPITLIYEYPPNYFLAFSFWSSQKFLLFFNMLAIFLKPLILRALRARKIKGLRKMAKVLFLRAFMFWDCL